MLFVMPTNWGLQLSMSGNDYVLLSLDLILAGTQMSFCNFTTELTFIFK